MYDHIVHVYVKNSLPIQRSPAVNPTIDGNTNKVTLKPNTHTCFPKMEYELLLSYIVVTHSKCYKNMLITIDSCMIIQIYSVFVRGYMYLFTFLKLHLKRV